MNNKTLKVLGTNVLVEIKDTEHKTRGGILLPDSSKEKISLTEARVIQKGPGFLLPSYLENDEITSLINQTDSVKIKYIPLEICENDIVFFNRQDSQPVFLDGKQFYIVPYLAIKLYVRDSLNEVL
jgi:co-chaperonin GroES (HSP10)